MINNITVYRDNVFKWAALSAEDIEQLALSDTISYVDDGNTISALSVIKLTNTSLNLAWYIPERNLAIKYLRGVRLNENVQTCALCSGRQLNILYQTEGIVYNPISVCKLCHDEISLNTSYYLDRVTDFGIKIQESVYSVYFLLRNTLTIGQFILMSRQPLTLYMSTFSLLKFYRCATCQRVFNNEEHIKYLSKDNDSFGVYCGQCAAIRVKLIKYVSDRALLIYLHDAALCHDIYMMIMQRVFDVFCIDSKK